MAASETRWRRAAAAGLAVQAHLTRTSSIVVLLAGLLVAGTAIYNGVNRLELTATNPVTGEALGDSLGTANPGIGIYVAGIGGALLVLGSLIQNREQA